MFGGLKIPLGFCGFLAITMVVVLGDFTFVERVRGQTLMTMPASGKDSKDLKQREKKLTSEFLGKVKLLGSYDQRKKKLIKRYINLSLELDKMNVVLRELKSADMAGLGESTENILMLEHRKIVSERSFVIEQIKEGLLRRYQLMEKLETLQKSEGSKSASPSDVGAEVRWAKGELRRLEERENWNWMLLKIREALHYLRRDVTKELGLIKK